MNIKSILVAAIIAATTFTQSLSAQTQPTLVTPVASIPNKFPTTFNQLKAYALSMVANIDGNLWATSASWKSNYFNVEYAYGDSDFEHMAQVASEQPLSITADPLDKMNASLSYWCSIPTKYGSSGYTLFSGSTNFHLVNSNGNWVVPEEARRIPLRMSDWIPFPIPGVFDAYIEELNENGDQVDFYDFDWDNRFDRGTGVLFIGREHLNHSGKLIMSCDDGSKVVFDLSNDGVRRETVTSAPTSIQGSIEGTRNIQVNQSAVLWQEGDGLLRCPFTTNTLVQVFFQPGQTKYPVSVHVINLASFAQNPAAEWDNFNPYSGNVVFKGVAGHTYYIRFEYADAPVPLPDYNYNGGGGGKGVIATPVTDKP